MESGDPAAETDSGAPFEMIEVLGSKIHKITLDNVPSSIEEWVKATQFLDAWGDVPMEPISLEI